MFFFISLWQGWNTLYINHQTKPAPLISYSAYSSGFFYNESLRIISTSGNYKMQGEKARSKGCKKVKSAASAPEVGLVRHLHQASRFERNERVPCEVEF